MAWLQKEQQVNVIMNVLGIEHGTDVIVETTHPLPPHYQVHLGDDGILSLVDGGIYIYIYTWGEVELPDAADAAVAVDGVGAGDDVGGDLGGKGVPVHDGGAEQARRGHRRLDLVGPAVGGCHCRDEQLQMQMQRWSELKRSLALPLLCSAWVDAGESGS